MNKRTLLYSVVLTPLLTLAGAVTSAAFANNINDTQPEATDDAGKAAPSHAGSASGKDVDALMKAMQEHAAKMDEHEEKLTEQEKKLNEQRRSFEEEKIQFEKLQTQMITLTGHAVALKSKTGKPGEAAVAANAGKQSSSTPEEVGTDKKATKDKPPEIAAVIAEGGVLTAPGKIVVTPAVEYTHSSATRVEINGFAIIPALNIGLFDISQVNRDMVTPSIDLRYGVTPRFEIEGKVPYVWRNDTTLQRPVGVPGAPNTLTSVSGSDIGDVEFGAHYQMNNGQGGWPYLIGNVRVKTDTGSSPFDVPIVGGVEQELPTGSGFYAVQPSVTAILPSDPVVYYSNFGYLHNFGKNFPAFGKIEPGDGFSGSMGTSLSLNDKSSVSVGYSHTMVLKTYQNGAPVSNSTVLQVGSIDVGFNYNLTDNTNLNFSVSGGVTADAPDVRLIFRVPMTFDLF